MKKIKWMILFFVILIMILAILLIQTKKGQNISEISNNIIENTQDVQEIENKLESAEELGIVVPEGLDSEPILNYVQYRTEYFEIREIYNKYLSLIADNSGDMLINLFSGQYCKNNNLNKDNIVASTGIKPITNISRDGTYVSCISDMLTVEAEENIKVYFVYGKYLLKSTSQIGKLNLMVVMDNRNKIYNIYPYSYMQQKQYDKLSINTKVTNITYNKIEDKTDNKIHDKTISDKEYVNYIFDNWKDLIIYDKSTAYQKINSGFASIKFKNYDGFEKYLASQKYIPLINQYRVVNESSYTDYICTDQYNNYYIFRQQGGVMRYTVFLDNYTVELNTFKENYEKADQNTKLVIQIGKLKQMLNSRDYNAIYNKLNSTFKQNNYNNTTKLKQYLEKNVYEINTILIDRYEEKEGYFVCNCILQNQKNKNEQKNMTIVMKLIDSNDFEMSFSF